MLDHKTATREGWPLAGLFGGQSQLVVYHFMFDPDYTAGCPTNSSIADLAEGFGVNVFARKGDAVYHSYSSGGRGVEFLMGYYPILDRTPMGRDEGDAFQTWLRRHVEYNGE